MCPPIMISIVFVTFFGLLSNSLIVESLDTNKTGEEAACAKFSVCNETAESNIRGHYRCMCDSNCSFYGDCCPESAYYNLSIQLNGKRDAQSLSCSKVYGIYMVDKCPPAFADDNLKRKCENILLGEEFDVQMVRPVMERISRITYSNAYCAQCNGVKDFEKFSLDYDCFQTYKKIVDKENLRKILQKAKFNPETGSLTSTINDNADYQCSYTVTIPNHLRPHTRNCQSEMISSCLETFNDSKVVEACHSQTLVVYTSPNDWEGDIYKNNYCARCNGVNDTDILSCQNDYDSWVGASTLFLSMPSTRSLCDDPDVMDLPVC